MRLAVIPRRKGRGFVLIAVLWMGLALLTAVAAQLSTGRGEALTLRAEQEGARATLLARSGLNLALAALSAAPGSGLPEVRRDGAPWTVAMAEGTVTLRIEDEAGKIDVNAAPQSLIRGALAQLEIAGADAFELSNVAQAIASWPDAAGPVPSLEALVMRGDLPPAVARRASGVLTVHNRTPRMDPTSAPPGVLAALPGLGPSDVEAILAGRDAGTESPALGAARQWLAPRRGPVFRLRATARLATGTTAELTTLVGERGLSFRDSLMVYEIMRVEVVQ